MRRKVLLLALVGCGTGGRTVLGVDDASVERDAAPECAPICEGGCRDQDGDGYESGAGGDCDDTMATIHPGAPDGRGWSVEPVPFGPWSALLVDGFGRPRIASGGPRDDRCAVDSWHQGSFSGVRYHERRAGAWTSEEVDDECMALGPAAAVSEGGEIVLAYALASARAGDGTWNFVTRVARRSSGGDWHVGDLSIGIPTFALSLHGCDSMILAGKTCWFEGEPCELRVWTSLEGDPVVVQEPVADSLGAVHDDDGLPYLSFFAPNVESLGEVRLARMTGDGWVVELVDVPCHGCLVFGTDPVVVDGAISVAYAWNRGLSVATRDDAGVWAPLLVDAAPPPPGGSWAVLLEDRVSMEADPEGHLHVAYLAVDEAVEGQVGLHYWTNRSGDWVMEEVGWPMAPVFFDVGYPSLAVDRLGMVHLSWYAPGEVGSPLQSDLNGRYAVLSPPRDGIDQDCDGVDGTDSDGDGRASMETGGDDPDDGSSSR